MLDKVGKYEFLAEPFHCDFSKRLFMGHLGNQMCIRDRSCGVLFRRPYVRKSYNSLPQAKACWLPERMLS